MSRIINFGVVGCGVISGTHIEAIQANPDVAKLVACCDVIPERADVTAEKHGIAAYYSLDEMLKHPGLDCICVCTPSGLHAECVLMAAETGVNAIVEKPADITKEKLDALVEVSRAGKVKVGCIFQRRTWSVVNRIKAAIESGELGTMFLANATMKWYRSQEYYNSGEWRGTWALDGGGALMNQGIHGMDLIYYLMGPVKSIKAHMATRTHEIEVEDSLTASMQFKSGALGTLCVTTSCVPGYNMRHDVHGSKGSISLEEDKIVEWFIEGQESQAEGPAEKAAISDPKNIGQEGHIALIRDMAEAIRDNRAPLITPDEGRTAVDLILAAYESARTGREITLC